MKPNVNCRIQSEGYSLSRALSKKTLMKLEDQGGPETATPVALKETSCSQMHDSIDLGNSFQKGIIRSITTVSHLINNNQSTDNRSEKNHLSRSTASCSSRNTDPFTSTIPVFFWSSKGSTFIGPLSKQDEPLKLSLGFQLIAYELSKQPSGQKLQKA